MESQIEFWIRKVFTTCVETKRCSLHMHHVMMHLYDGEQHGEQHGEQCCWKKISLVLHSMREVSNIGRGKACSKFVKKIDFIGILDLKGCKF